MFKMKVVLLLMLFSVVYHDSSAQPKTDAFLKSLLEQNTHPVFKKVLQQPQTYRLQIIYTQIDRDKKNVPSFKNYYFNYDPKLYFNPASTVKMPLAFLALEKLNEMKIKGVNKYTPIQFDSSYKGQKTAYKDSTSANGLPSIAHYIKKAFLISDNDAYNRFYQFVGQQTINKKLHEKGYPNARITRQFMGFTEEANRHTNQVRFITKKGKLIYTQPAAYNPDAFDFSQVVKIGKAHLDSKDSLVNGPFDFTKHNNITLEDYQQMLQSVLFPESVPAKQRFNLTKDDQQFLLQFLSQYPSETNFPKYDFKKYYDSYVKFFFSDSTHNMPPHVRVFNKVGWAYGFSTDISYVVDLKENIEYMLAATLYVNSDEIVNDGKYDYEKIANPFLYQLGQTVYQHELQRDRLHKPKLSRFNIKYERRDPKDTRRSIKDADN
ncbi:MAG TPA: serine hydrolase [Segetibacter sp.]